MKIEKGNAEKIKALEIRLARVEDVLAGVGSDLMRRLGPPEGANYPVENTNENAVVRGPSASDLHNRANS